MSTTFATTVATTVAITVAEYRLAASLQDAASFRRCAELPIKCKLAPCPSQLPGIALALLHLALYDCQGLQLHFSNASLHLALHNCPGLHLHFAPCPLRLPGIAVALYALAPCTLTRVMCQREGEREMETLGRRREKKCRDALSFRSRKNNFYATNEKTRLLAQSVFARMDLSI